MADRYGLAPLRSLVVQRLAETCNPLEDEIDFIEALRVIDECTAADDTIWDLLLPRVKANMQALLKNEIFKQVVSEQSALNLRLLDSFSASASIQSPDESGTLSPANLPRPSSKRFRPLGDEDGRMSTHEKVRLLEEEVQGFEARLAAARQEASQGLSDRLEKFKGQAKEQNQKQNTRLAESRATIVRLNHQLEAAKTELREMQVASNGAISKTESS